MECLELAPAFEPRHTSDSGSKLHALHTLRETRPPLSSVCAICSVSPENLRKKTRFSPILFSAPGHDPDNATTRTRTRREKDCNAEEKNDRKERRERKITGQSRRVGRVCPQGGRAGRAGRAATKQKEEAERL